jgi:hypothetical protein
MELGNKLSSAKIMNGLIKLVSLLAVELVLVGGLALYMSVTNNVAPASRPASLASVGALKRLYSIYYLTSHETNSLLTTNAELSF